jgi:anhydro-N-acetylmuramic acid kinase
VLGLNSGTSINSLDWAMVRFFGLRPDVKLVDAGEIRFPAALQKALKKCGASDRVLKAGLSCLDAEFGTWLGRQVVKIRHRHARSTPIDFVASHGQTVGHWPSGGCGASLQIGDPDRIAKMSGLPVISHFRQGDLAVGGEGAPLTPAVNQLLFARPKIQIAMLNLGGIANLTLIPPAGSRKSVRGTDCGPGNVLLDLAAVRFLRRAYDPGGRLAVTGDVNRPLLATAQRHPWFLRKLPASCGREEFGHAFFSVLVARHSRVSGRDVAATLAHLTAWSVARALGRLGGRPKVL